MEPATVGIAMLLAIVVLMGLRVPIGIALILPAIVGISLIVGEFRAGPIQAVTSMFSVFSQQAFVIIPLYILLGTLAYATRIAQDAFGMMQRWLAPVPGGLAVAASFGSGLFAAVTGSSMATVATMSRTAFPEMLRHNYSQRLAASTIVASGSVGILIPPSIILVLYGILAEQSIGRLLLAGIIPGLLTLIANAAAILLIVRRHPEWAPRAERFPLRERLAWTIKGWPVIVVFMVVVGGIYTGLWLPSESAASGVAAVVLIALARRTFNLRLLWEGLSEAVRLSISIFFILAGAVVLARLLAVSGLSRTIVSGVTSLAAPEWIVLVAILLVLFAMGTFVEGTTILALTVPIVVPAIIALDYDPIWFGVVMVKLVEMSLLTPPVGLNVYTFAATVPSISASSLFRGIWPFLIADGVVVAALIAMPRLVTFVPDAAFG